MNTETRQILQLLAEGKVTADEAERLIDAVERQEPQPPQDVALRQKRRPRYIRVLVADDGSASDRPSRINIRVPIQLLRAGVRLASLVPPQALERVNVELDKAGVPIDLTQLRAEQLEELVDQLDDVTIDIDDPGSKIQVFCE